MEEGTYFAGFVLCDFVLGVLFALFALAVGAAGFGDVDLGFGDVLLAGGNRLTAARDVRHFGMKRSTTGPAFWQAKVEIIRMAGWEIIYPPASSSSLLHSRLPSHMHSWKTSEAVAVDVCYIFHLCSCLPSQFRKFCADMTCARMKESTRSLPS